MPLTTDSTVTVTYDGTDRGRIYLSDVGQRNQLGGGQGIYTLGQDRYLSKDQTATFIKTGAVMMSASYAGYDRTGILKHFEDQSSFTISD